MLALQSFERTLRFDACTYLSGTMRPSHQETLPMMRARSLLKLGQRSGTPKWMNWTNDTSRPKGDIRIERLKDEKRNGGSSKGNITDADFEEVK